MYSELGNNHAHLATVSGNHADEHYPPQPEHFARPGLDFDRQSPHQPQIWRQPDGVRLRGL
jgi:hypothetical protein